MHLTSRLFHHLYFTARAFHSCSLLLHPICMSAGSSISDAVDYAGIFAQTSGITKGWIQEGERSDKILLQRSVRDLDGNKVRSFVSSYELTEGKWRSCSPFPQELNGVVIFSPSPSGRKLVVVREAPSKGDEGGSGNYVIEIWETRDGENSLVDRILTSGIHDKIVGGTCFGGFSWSTDETKAVYVARRKAPETRSYFSKEPKPSGSKSVVPAIGEQFLYKEDWGEKYEGVDSVGLFVVDMGDSGRVSELKGVREGLTPGQPHFSKDGNHIVYTGWESLPRKLGMIYCYQRPCNLFAAPTQGLFKDEETQEGQKNMPSPKPDVEGIDQSEDMLPCHICLCPSWRLAHSARFSPCGEQVIWLSREEGFDTHSGCFRMTIAQWDSKTGDFAGSPRTLVDVVTDVDESGKNSFPGLWLDDLPDACWSTDGLWIYLTSAWGSRESVTRVNVKTGEVSRVKAALLAAGQDQTAMADASAAVLATCSRGVLVCASSPNSPGGFAMLSTESGSDEVSVGPAVGVAAITSSIRVSRSRSEELRGLVAGISWRVLDVPSGTDGSEGPPFEAILLQPQESLQEEAKRVPLVVVPHGGPHGVMPTAFVPAYAYLCASQKLAILHVNFRGSTGFGTTALESLPGKIGCQDVADVVAAVQVALAAEPDALDPERVGVVGGSHGGFLGAHLSAQYPDLFKVAALRNPVTNIASMVTVSDIPDWCYIEALGIGSYEWDSFSTPTADELRRMWEASPVAHIKGVRAPTLIAIGKKDRRVPASQGIEWYHALKSKDVPSKLLIYPEDVHAIDKPASEADHWVSISKWIQKYI